MSDSGPYESHLTTTSTATAEASAPLRPRVAAWRDPDGRSQRARPPILRHPAGNPAARYLASRCPRRRPRARAVAVLPAVTLASALLALISARRGRGRCGARRRRVAPWADVVDHLVVGAVPPQGRRRVHARRRPARGHRRRPAAAGTVRRRRPVCAGGLVSVPDRGRRGRAVPPGAQRVWSSIEGRHDHLRWAAHREDTGWPAGGSDAPGAVLVTSTRTDLHELRARPLRAERGPVRVFNLSRWADLPRRSPSTR
ncbi:hypothetical protein HBB16_06450 [Pseudonocardia sp. MCCB 268]|nr:hypothetical protein [Pseudonocardia cytotoxica]